MDIKTLRYFLTVAQEKNITRAAEKLFLAQPPLSRQMKLLEQELGVTLFIRGKRQIRLKRGITSNSRRKRSYIFSKRPNST